MDCSLHFVDRWYRADLIYSRDGTISRFRESLCAVGIPGGSIRLWWKVRHGVGGGQGVVLLSWVSVWGDRERRECG
ncbi:hypothetical protein BDW69DRAFT_176755 [Aspergillus filifer]